MSFGLLVLRPLNLRLFSLRLLNDGSATKKFRIIQKLKEIITTEIAVTFQTVLGHPQMQRIVCGSVLNKLAFILEMFGSSPELLCFLVVMLQVSKQCKVLKNVLKKTSIVYCTIEHHF